MTRIKLSSTLGDISVIVLYLIAIEILGIFLYNVIVIDYTGMFAGLFFLLFYLIVFGRKTFRMKKVYFDKEYIYVAKFDKIHLSNILKIDERKIEFNDNGETRNIYFNYYYLSDNYYLLKTYIKNIQEESTR